MTLAPVDGGEGASGGYSVRNTRGGGGPFAEENTRVWESPAVGRQRATATAPRGKKEQALAEALERSLRLRGYSPKTVKLYVGVMCRYQVWLRDNGRADRAERADDLDLHDYAETLPLTYSSRMNLAKAYKAWWRHGLKRVGVSPADFLRVPSRPKLPYRGLDAKEQAHALLEAARGMGLREHAVCSLLYFAGLRNDECAGLPRSAPRDGWLAVVGKGFKTRLVPIHAELALALDALEATRGDDSRWMFPGRGRDKHISTATVNAWVHLAAAAAGLGTKVTPHTLRRTAGALFCEKMDGDLRATAEFLGHSMDSLDVTAEIYTRTTDTRLKKGVSGL